MLAVNLIEWSCPWCGVCNHDETGQGVVRCHACRWVQEEEFMVANGTIVMENVPQTAQQKRGYIAGLRVRYPTMFSNSMVAITITGDEDEFIYFNGYHFSCDGNGNTKVEPIGDA